MNDQIFKKCIFGGYQKESVHAYLCQFDADMSGKIDALGDQVEALQAENAALIKQNDILKAKLEERDKQTEHVARALLNAEKKAEEIIADALSESKQKKEALEGEIAHAALILKKMNQDIRQIREGVISSVNKYESELDSLIRSTDRDHKPEETEE